MSWNRRDIIHLQIHLHLDIIIQNRSCISLLCGCLGRYFNYSKGNHEVCQTSSSGRTLLYPWAVLLAGSWPELALEKYVGFYQLVSEKVNGPIGSILTDPQIYFNIIFIYMSLFKKWQSSMRHSGDNFVFLFMHATYSAYLNSFTIYLQLNDADYIIFSTCSLIIMPP
jgi:hypothetical protein